MKVEEIQKLIPNCKIAKIKTHSKEWFEYRKEVVNSSELGILAGVVKYGSPAKIYYEKLGIAQPNESNEFTFLGSYYEQSIKDLWCYHTGEAGSYVRNFEEGRKIRDYIDVDAYLSNPKYPWLSGSVDGLIDPNAYHGLNLATMSRLEEPGILECKRVSSWAARAYGNDVNPGHQLQVQSYLLITGLKYGEIATMLEGGLRIDLVLADKQIQEYILDMSKGFYDNHIVPGLKAKELFNRGHITEDDTMIEEATAMIHEYQPEADGSDDYKDYISETFNKEREFIMAPEGIYEKAKQSTAIKQLINGLEAKRKQINNSISEIHNREATEYFSLGRDNELGYTRYFIKGKNKRHELNIMLKEDLPDNFVDKQINKLDIKSWNL